MKPHLLATLALYALCAMACTHSDLARNAPGHISVQAPPKDMAEREPEIPEDPGERMLVLTYGAFAGGGVLKEDDSDVAGDYALGPEFSLELGERERSHFEDDFFVIPDHSLGLRFGLSVLDSNLAPPGAGYTELAYTETLARVGAGWAWDVDDARHGPQITVAAGPLYLRGTRLFGYGTSVHAGLLIGGSHAWVWSR